MIARLSTPLLLLAALALAGCGLFNGDGKPKTPVVGKRVPVLVAETGVEVDPAIADVEVLLPPPAANTDWTLEVRTRSRGSRPTGSLYVGAWNTPLHSA